MSMTFYFLICHYNKLKFIRNNGMKTKILIKQYKFSLVINGIFIFMTAICLDNDNKIYSTYQFGIPPTKTSEFVVNFPKWNSLPRDVRVCDTPSTVSVVCSSFR